MTKKLHISEDLALPIDTVTSTLVVYGGKGMGKTNLASVLVEEIDANGLRFAFLDPVGVSWGLRHSLDGKGRGIEILILGGIHGDIPIEPTGGGVVADLVVDESVNVLIDVSRRPDGSMWSIGERIRFVTDYCKRLYQRQGEKRRPIMQIIDEAARFAPQTVRKGEEQVAACMGAIAVLVEEGRNVGIGVTLLTLRSARLNKDVAELADCMIAFRTVGPNSRAAVLDWLGEHVDKGRLRELDITVRQLPVGSALVVSPGWLEFEGVVAMRARRTFDSSKTPKPGEQVRASGPGAKPDLDKYQERMAETIERAAENDPKQLRKKYEERIRDLEKQLKAKPIAAAAPAKEPKADPEKLRAMAQKEADRAVAKALRPVFAALKRIPAEISAASVAIATVQERVAKVSAAVADLKVAAEEMEKAGATVDVAAAQTIRMPQTSTRPAEPIVARPTPRPAVVSQVIGGNGADVDIKPVHLRILNALAELEALGAAAPERILVAFMSGYSHTNSTGFAKAVSTLKTEGLIDYTSGGGIVITSAGRQLAAPVDAPTTTEEVQRRIVSILKPVHGRVLQPVIDIYPGAMSREELARQSGYSHVNSTGFAKAVNHLSSLGFLTYPTKGDVAAAPVLFLEGRA